MSVLDWINLWLFYFFRFNDFPTCYRKFLLFFGKTNSVRKILCHQFWPYKLDEVPKRQRWYLIRGDEGSFDQTRYLEVSDLTNIFIILIKLFNLYRVLECKKIPFMSRLKWMSREDILFGCPSCMGEAAEHAHMLFCFSVFSGCQTH